MALGGIFRRRKRADVDLVRRDVLLATQSALSILAGEEQLGGQRTAPHAPQQDHADDRHGPGADDQEGQAPLQLQVQHHEEQGIGDAAVAERYAKSLAALFLGSVLSLDGYFGDFFGRALG